MPDFLNYMKLEVLGDWALQLLHACLASKLMLIRFILNLEVGLSSFMIFLAYSGPGWLLVRRSGGFQSARQQQKDDEADAGCLNSLRRFHASFLPPSLQGAKAAPANSFTEEAARFRCEFTRRSLNAMQQWYCFSGHWRVPLKLHSRNRPC